MQRCGIAGHIIHTESKSDGLKRHRHDTGDLRGVLSRGTRRQRRNERASTLAAVWVASSLVAARNRCIYVGDSCQRYLACAFLRLKDPKDGVNDILANVRANDRPARRTDAPQRTTAGVTSTLELDHVGKMNKHPLGISTILLRKKAQEIETVQIRDARLSRKYKFSWDTYISQGNTKMMKSYP